MEEVIASGKVQVERKLFYFDLKQNPRGRFLKITEDVRGRRDTIIIPSTPRFKTPARSVTNSPCAANTKGVAATMVPAAMLTARSNSLTRYYFSRRLATGPFRPAHVGTGKIITRASLHFASSPIYVRCNCQSGRLAFRHLVALALSWHKLCAAMPLRLLHK